MTHNTATQSAMMFSSRDIETFGTIGTQFHRTTIQPWYYLWKKSNAKTTIDMAFKCRVNF